jgi:protease-4
MNEESIQARRSPLLLLATFIVVIVLPLLVGLYIAPRLVPKPKIGIAYLTYDIGSDTAYFFTEQMAVAREDESIKGVMIIVNSPGGSAAYSEELYLDVLGTRDVVPVVVSVDLLAASGAYYMAAAADEIYAKPTSIIGSIGVIATLPGPVFIEEDLLTTGPYKAFGGTRDSFMRSMEMSKHAFLEAIATGRGDRLKVDLNFLSRAEVYNGVQALDYGLIDGLKSGDEVIKRTAELAGLSNYDVVDLLDIVFDDLLGEGDGSDYRPVPVDAQALWAPPTDLPTGLYFRYIEPFPN